MAKITKKKNKRKVESGIAHIHATWNNTIITITDDQGNALAWASAGTSGFKGSKKSTPFAAQQAAFKVLENVKPYGIKKVKVETNGTGSGRDTSVKTLQAGGLEIISIKDVTPRPHNGCRLPKNKIR